MEEISHTGTNGYPFGGLSKRSFCLLARLSFRSAFLRLFSSFCSRSASSASTDWSFAGLVADPEGDGSGACPWGAVFGVGANPLIKVSSVRCIPRKERKSVQSHGEGIGLCLFDFPDFLRTLGSPLTDVSVVPMDVFILLPSTCRRVYTMTEVVLRVGRVRIQNSAHQRKT
jgi:hypothetical protein